MNEIPGYKIIKKENSNTFIVKDENNLSKILFRCEVYDLKELNEFMKKELNALKNKCNYNPYLIKLIEFHYVSQKKQLFVIYEQFSDIGGEKKKFEIKVLQFLKEMYKAVDQLQLLEKNDSGIFKNIYKSTSNIKYKIKISIESIIYDKKKDSSSNSDTNDLAELSLRLFNIKKVEEIKNSFLKDLINYLRMENSDFSDLKKLIFFNPIYIDINDYVSIKDLLNKKIIKKNIISDSLEKDPSVMHELKNILIKDDRDKISKFN